MAKVRAEIVRPSRRDRLPKGMTERLVEKGARALESLFDAVAEDPRGSIERGSEFVGRLFETVDKARGEYKRNPEAARQEIKSAAVGVLAELGKRKKRGHRA